MRLLFRILRDVLILLAVALVAALITMSLAVHGSEVTIPDLTGLSTPEADARARELQLKLSVENRYFSATVPAGHLLAQSPPPGTHVRRDWSIRAAESLGPQLVAIPSVTGLSERDATITIERAGLTLGTVAHLPPDPSQIPAATPSPEIVLAQSPPPAGAADSPRVSILLGPNPSPAPVSVQKPSPHTSPIPNPSKSPQPATLSPSKTAPITTQKPTESTAKSPVTMPKLTGLTISQALKILSDSGLHIAAIEDLPITPKSPSPVGSTAAIAKPPAPAPLPGTVLKQSPTAATQTHTGADVRLTVAR